MAGATALPRPATPLLSNSPTPLLSLRISWVSVSQHVSLGLQSTLQAALAKLTPLLWRSFPSLHFASRSLPQRERQLIQPTKHHTGEELDLFFVLNSRIGQSSQQCAKRNLGLQTSQRRT